MQQAFYELADYLAASLEGDEVFLARFSGEESDFVRINQDHVRQAGSVLQRYMAVDLIRGQRHVEATITLSGDMRPIDVALTGCCRTSVSNCRMCRKTRICLYSTEVRSTQRCGQDDLPASNAALDAILAAGKGVDLVGLYAQGPIYAGFANSFGQRNWFSSYSFNFDFSIYHAADKAVKSAYAGFAWDQVEFERKMRLATEQLAVLSQPARTIDPGQYRVYLAPAALKDIAGMLSSGGFSMKAHRTKTTPLLKMIAEDATLSPLVTIRENTKEGIAPDFQAAGYLKPDEVVRGRKGTVQGLPDFAAVSQGVRCAAERGRGL